MRDLKLPKKSEINTAIHSFSRKERRIFGVLLVVLFISTILILQNINKSFMVSVPTPGGEIREGIIGTPRFINPILAFSDADQDMVSLIYSGLMRKGPEGVLLPDLAEKYEVSKNNLVYTFTLKEDLIFHDGRPLDADDVVFTISKVKDSVINSPKKSAWDGMAVEKVDDRTVKFTLKQPYASFLDNTTLGIFPEHIWNNSPIELNLANVNPVGSGPYLVKSIGKKDSGVVNYYELERFEDFVLSKPYIKTFYAYFYQNEKNLVQALKNQEVDQVSSISPKNADLIKREGYRVESATLPRVFGLFLNYNQNQIFLNKTVVKAINDTIDKNRIIEEVLDGYGVAIDTPIPPSLIDHKKIGSGTAEASREEALKKAEAALQKDGWKKNASGFLEKTTTVKGKKTATPLAFSISTGNAPELVQAAELIREDLSKVGINVEIKTFEVGNLNQNVIRPRKYEALLFGQIINHESDLFAFWHSSQRRDPGLNVSMYTNAKVDKILEDAFVTIDEKARAKKYADFENEIKKDMPAVFLYSPNFIYVVSGNLDGLDMDNIISSSDRFGSVYLWFTEKDNVWKIFSRIN